MDGKVFVIGRDSIPARTVLSEGESLQWTFVALPGTSCEMTVEIDATAPGCSIDLAGLYICKGEDRLKLRVLLRHECGDCTSRQLFKGIVGDSAKDPLISIRATYSDGEEFIIKEFNEEDAFIYSEEDEGYPPEECLI